MRVWNIFLALPVKNGPLPAKLKFRENTGNLCETSDNVLSQTHVIIWGHWVDLQLWGQGCLMLVVLQNRQSPDFKSPEVGTSEGDGFSQMKWPRLQLIVVHCTEITFSI